MWLFRRIGASGFSSSSTAEEVTKGIDASGLTAIVTGASSGIGLETTRALAKRGVHVVMGIRNMPAGKKVKEDIIKDYPAAKVDAMELDLSSLQSVRNFASQFSSSGLPLNILINNAGIMIPPFTLSADKIELQFATNYLGHFLLTHLLLDTMKKTARDTKREGRIVNVSSIAHRYSYREGIRFHKINDEKCYSRFPAYGQSKLANILHANELTRRLKEEGGDIIANSVHPGVITTNLFRYTGLFEGVVSTIGRMVLKNVEQGASTTCYVALHPQLKGISGQYFSDNNLDKPNAKATDKDLGTKLWDFRSGNGDGIQDVQFEANLDLFSPFFSRAVAYWYCNINSSTTIIVWGDISSSLLCNNVNIHFFSADQRFNNDYTIEAIIPRPIIRTNSVTCQIFIRTRTF